MSFAWAASWGGQNCGGLSAVGRSPNSTESVGPQLATKQIEIAVPPAIEEASTAPATNGAKSSKRTQERPNLPTEVAESAKTFSSANSASSCKIRFVRRA